ncbi:hypothetical protein ACFX15_027330 [Malus domestica]
MRLRKARSRSKSKRKHPKKVKALAHEETEAINSGLKPQRAGNPFQRFLACAHSVGPLFSSPYAPTCNYVGQLDPETWINTFVCQTGCGNHF